MDKVDLYNTSKNSIITICSLMTSYLFIHKCSTTILSETFHNVYLEEPSIIIGDKNYPSESIHSDSENTIHWTKRM